MMISHMSLPSNIAKNEALSENVFMMVICIELLIPLFVSHPSFFKTIRFFVSLWERNTFRNVLENKNHKNTKT